MRLGVWLPVVSAHPGSGDAGWTASGTADDLRLVAQAAEQAGYDVVCVPEHVALPVGRQAGTTYWDPVSTLGFLAAATDRIRLAVLVAVLAYHHPLELAKRYGTLQRLAGSRVVVGVSAGGTREEFDLLGVPFDDRGRRADDAMRALRAAMGTAQPSYQGEFIDFQDVIVDPTLESGTPLWVGGASAAALRRALEHGDGWAPTGLDAPTLKQRLAAVADRRAERPGFEVVYLASPGDVLDPSMEADRAMENLAAAAAAGVTVYLPRLHSRSAAHYGEQLAALAELAAARG